MVDDVKIRALDPLLLQVLPVWGKLIAQEIVVILSSLRL